MTNVSSCYRHKTSEDIVYDYKSLVKVFLDDADRYLRESNISIDCKESTLNPQNQTIKNINNIVCRMDRWEASFKDRLVETVKASGECGCRHDTAKATRPPLKRRTLCKVKSLLSSMRNIYESVCAQSSHRNSEVATSVTTL
ncbi:uncharacterized protein LOC115537182 isoform X2 [Gadus morhua]|uniref:uncharacterized protein LOC115537182 isoform X2 n=1 Tax=Gadus morhua TaxID=8049 RepID=UPI0011B7CA44|nr:uncharacterized protein LOC115537182 isoform X2 [Gadus morhua]